MYKQGENVKMRHKMHKGFPTFLCLLTLYWVMFSGFFTYTFGLPETIYYASDVFIILLLLIEIRKIKNAILHGSLKVPALCVAGLLAVGFISAIIAGGSIARSLWAIRNWGRFFAYFAVCVCVLDRQRINKVINFYMGFVHINCVVIIIQFVFLSSLYGQDALNGFLGRDTSAVNLVYSNVVSILVIAAFRTKKISKNKMLMVLFEIMIISVLAELKANIFFVALLYIMAALAVGRFTTKQITKNIIIIVFVCAAAIATMNLLVHVYPNFKDILTLDGLWEQMAGEHGYGNHGYINRLTAISVINKYFFNAKGLFSKLLGLGIGNVEYSKFSIFTSPFYSVYGEIFSYLGFSSAVLYLEVGLLGLLFFFMFHINLINVTYKKIKANVGNNIFYYCVGYLMAIFTTILIVYNNLHRTDASIILAFFLAVPFASERIKGGQKE